VVVVLNAMRLSRGMAPVRHPDRPLPRGAEAA